MCGSRHGWRGVSQASDTGDGCTPTHRPKSKRCDMDIYLYTIFARPIVLRPCGQPKWDTVHVRWMCSHVDVYFWYIRANANRNSDRYRHEKCKFGNFSGPRLQYTGNSYLSYINNCFAPLILEAYKVYTNKATATVEDAWIYNMNDLGTWSCMHV